MKKLMIAFIATMMGIAAHAAAYTWANTINVYDWNGTYSPAEGAIQFWVNDNDMGSYAFDAIGNATFSFGIDEGNAIKAVCTINNFSDGAGTMDWTYEFTITGYPAADDAMKAMAQSAQTAFNLGGALNFNKTIAENGYTPIPEPTSGLLLLIGMGTLALRRKQA